MIQKNFQKKIRELLFDELIELEKSWKCILWIWIKSNEIVDAIGIKKANKLAMEDAIKQVLSRIKDSQKIELKIDWNDNYIFDWIDLVSTFIIKWDTKIDEIKAASIFAKVTRDRMMWEYSKEFSWYLFENNVWYGTEKHMKWLKKFWICKIHRLSYAPIKKILDSKTKKVRIKKILYNIYTMKIQKIITLALLSCLPLSIALAETSTPITQDTITNLQNMINRFSNTITQLQEENSKLKDQIAELNKKLGIPETIIPKIIVATWSISNSWALTLSGTTNNAIAKPTSVDKYNKLIEKINSMSGQIFRDSQFSTGSSIGLFEFIEPSSFFISIDDWANPAWVTAFKRKMLYSYDKDYNLNVDWIFNLDYKSQYYITKYGKNPFAKAVRIKVKNPEYKWKLLDADNSSAGTVNIPKTTNSTSTAIKTNAPTSTINTANVTLDTVKLAYSKNKILDALKLSTEYIKTDSNNMEVAKIRYRSFYILGKYDEALSEIQKIENNLGNQVEKTILCDAKIISKLAKKIDLNKKYADLCASKK